MELITLDDVENLQIRNKKRMIIKCIECNHSYELYPSLDGELLKLLTNPRYMKYRDINIIKCSKCGCEKFNLLVKKE